MPRQGGEIFAPARDPAEGNLPLDLMGILTEFLANSCDMTGLSAEYQICIGQGRQKGSDQCRVERDMRLPDALRFQKRDFHGRVNPVVASA